MRGLSISPRYVHAPNDRPANAPMAHESQVRNGGARVAREDRHDVACEPEHRDGVREHLRRRHRPPQPAIDVVVAPNANKRYRWSRYSSTRSPNSSPRLAIQIVAAVSTDHANSGTRASDMPVVRRPRTVVARHTDARTNATTTMPERGEEEVDALVVASERSAVDQVADDDHAAADEERPERRGCGTRKGDRLRAHLAGNDDHGDADEDRDREQEQAADAVQRQRLRVVVLVEDVVRVGLEALGAEDAAEDSGHARGRPATSRSTGGRWPRAGRCRGCRRGRQPGRARLLLVSRGPARSRARPRAESRSSPWLGPDSIHARSDRWKTLAPPAMSPSLAPRPEQLIEGDGAEEQRHVGDRPREQSGSRPVAYIAGSSCTANTVKTPPSTMADPR